MTTWFTADTHFGHANVLKHGRNQFTSIEEHDEALITNWNSVVFPGDRVIHCGDFAWKNPLKYLNRLNGQIHLVLGNHDRLKAPERDAFASVHDVLRVKVGEQSIYCCHYAWRVWKKARSK